MSDSIWDRRHAAAAAIGCSYRCDNSRSAGHKGGRHVILRDNREVARGRTFNASMSYALECIYSESEPPVPVEQLLVG